MLTELYITDNVRMLPHSLFNKRINEVVSAIDPENNRKHSHMALDNNILAE